MFNPLDKLELDNKKILSIVMASLLLVYLDFNFLMKLQFRGLKEVGVKITKLKTDIDNLTKDLTDMQALKNKQMTGEEFKLRAKKIISEGKIPSLLQNISDMANKNNVRIIKILPLKDSKVKEAKAAVASSLLITLNLSCNYHNLGKFINELENAAEFMLIEGLEIRRDANNYLSQNVNLVLRTYVKK